MIAAATGGSRSTTDAGAGAGRLELLQKEMPALWEGDLRWREPLAKYTTFRVGGPATCLVYVREVSALSKLVKGLAALDVPWWVIGRGSNLLVPDHGLDGVVIVMGRDFSKLTLLSPDRLPTATGTPVLVNVQAGCRLAQLVRWSMEEGVSGLEFTAGLPGTIGGGLVMNAGAWGKDLGSLIRQANLMEDNGTVITLNNKELQFGYRSCRGARGKTVIDVTLELVGGNPYSIDEECQEVIGKRLAKQPLQTASAGSFFKNSARRPAGKLIEEAGLKGYACGGAKVSAKHANFIVNNGTATAADIYALMQIVQRRVYETSGIILEPEVQLVGEWDDAA